MKSIIWKRILSIWFQYKFLIPKAQDQQQQYSLWQTREVCRNIIIFSSFFSLFFLLCASLFLIRLFYFSFFFCRYSDGILFCAFYMLLLCLCVYPQLNLMLMPMPKPTSMCYRRWIAPLFWILAVSINVLSLTASASTIIYLWEIIFSIRLSVCV